MAETEAPKDEEFRHMNSILTLQEHSTCFCRVCCGHFREFTMDVSDTNNNRLYEYHRPYHCCIICCPQEIFVRDNSGSRIGSVVCECRCIRMCCCGELHFKVKDENQKAIGYIKHITPSCCNCCRNCCAPSCCNTVWENEVLDYTGNTIVGKMRNVFPGLGCRCIADADNYLLSFPEGSSADHKSIFLAGMILIDYLCFEKQPDSQ